MLVQWLWIWINKIISGIIPYCSTDCWFNYSGLINFQFLHLTGHLLTMAPDTEWPIAWPLVHIPRWIIFTRASVRPHKYISAYFMATLYDFISICIILTVKNISYQNREKTPETNIIAFAHWSVTVDINKKNISRSWKLPGVAGVSITRGWGEGGGMAW